VTNQVIRVSSAGDVNGGDGFDDLLIEAFADPTVKIRLARAA